jgi:hypothetical protein
VTFLLDVNVLIALIGHGGRMTARRVDAGAELRHQKSPQSAATQLRIDNGANP